MDLEQRVAATLLLRLSILTLLNITSLDQEHKSYLDIVSRAVEAYFAFDKSMEPPALLSLPSYLGWFLQLLCGTEWMEEEERSSIIVQAVREVRNGRKGCGNVVPQHVAEAANLPGGDLFDAGSEEVAKWRAMEGVRWWDAWWAARKVDCGKGTIKALAPLQDPGCLPCPSSPSCRLVELVANVLASRPSPLSRPKRFVLASRAPSPRFAATGS